MWGGGKKGRGSGKLSKRTAQGSTGTGRGGHWERCLGLGVGARAWGWGGGVETQQGGEQEERRGRVNEMRNEKRSKIEGGGVLR